MVQHWFNLIEVVLCQLDCLELLDDGPILFSDLMKSASVSINVLELLIDDAERVSQGRELVLRLSLS